MNVNLVSQDSELLNMCREILNECDDLDLHLSMSAPGTSPSGADLCIWDGMKTIDLSRKIDRPFPKHLFLLHQTELVEFHENLGTSEAAILLKPVTRACLAAFLGFAASALQNRISTPQSLRAERDEILQCLIQSNLQLQQYEQDRTNFLTRAVHDFRAPLTATGGYCGLLLDGALGPLTEEQREVLRRMQQSIKRLSRMASAMFELGVGRQVKRRPDLRPADIQGPVEQALHEITPLADSKKISISVELAQEEGKAYLDPAQIEQVLVNLLDNACKFAPKGGEIEVKGYPFFWERRAAHQTSAPVVERRHRDYRSSNSYRVDIRDSGPPIPIEHIANIFEEYTSYVGSQDRSGGGLGLAICRMIVHAHEGRVWMENTEYGPRFSFVLPVHSAKLEGLRIEHQEELANSRGN